MPNPYEQTWTWHWQQKQLTDLFEELILGINGLGGGNVTISLLHLLSTPFSFCDNTSLAATCAGWLLFISTLLLTWLLLWLFQEHVVACHLSFYFDWTCVHLASFIHAFTLTFDRTCFDLACYICLPCRLREDFRRSLHCPTHSDRTRSDSIRLLFGWNTSNFSNQSLIESDRTLRSVLLITRIPIRFFH